jgi:tripartite ATP-independent transporter DctP family solute receptor
VKKHIKKSIIAMLSVFVIGSLAACGGGGTSEQPSGNSQPATTTEKPAEKTEKSKDPIEIKFAHVGSEQHQYHIAATKFKELIESKSDGGITVKVFHGGQLGGEGDAVEGIQAGTIDMTAVAADSAPANVVPELNVYGVPYLFQDRAHVYKVLEGEIGQELLDKATEKGLRGLGYWEIGFSNFTNSKREIHTPEDMKGLKLRVQPAPIWDEFMKRLDALPTPMGFTELYGAMEQGVVDGQENPIATIDSMKFYEVSPYIALTKHTYKAATVLVSDKIWNQLSDDQKKLLEETVRETYTYQRDYLEQKEQETLESLKATGKVTITEPDLAKFAEVTEGIESTVADKVPAELVERIKAAQ